MQKLIPLGDKVFIQPDSGSDVSEGGIILTKQEAPCTGVVVFASNHPDMTVRPGDRVRYAPGAGIPERDLLLIEERNIFYIYERAEAADPILPESGS